MGRTDRTSWRFALPLLVAAVALRAAPARADPPPALNATMADYFAGEGAQGAAWLAAGSASLVVGGTLLAQEGRVLRGASYPLLAVGVIQLVAGVSALARSDGRLADLRSRAARDPQEVREGEALRIGRINSLFRVITAVEYSLLGLGAAGTAVGGALGQNQILGAGIGLAVEAAAMLTLDHFAEARAHRYADALGRVAITLAPRPEERVVVLGVAGRF